VQLLKLRELLTYCGTQFTFELRSRNIAQAFTGQLLFLGWLNLGGHDGEDNNCMCKWLWWGKLLEDRKWNGRITLRWILSTTIRIGGWLECMRAVSKGGLGQ